ncbi:MAG: phosphoesterase, partial [Bacteroidota bacterium]
MYDIIGDIHGHADKLEELLKKLGYSKKKKEFSHSER